MPRLPVATLLLAVAAACGPSGPGITWNGTVGGFALQAQEAFVTPLVGNDGQVRSAALTVTDRAGLCGQLKANRQPKGMTYAVLVLAQVDAVGNGFAPVAGDYTVFAPSAQLPQGNVSQGFFAALDERCANKLATDTSTFVSGLVRLSTVRLDANGRARGTFDATVGTQQDRVTGSFDVPVCTVPSMTAMPSCE